MVYLVGAGIGDYRYISLMGMELIKICDVLIYDRLIDNSLLSFVKKECKFIYVGKASNNHSVTQEEINKILVNEANNNNIVVRLKGGDPFVFGRGGEEAETLISHNIPFKIIPGITSAIAAPEICGIPVTHRQLSQSLHIITGHTAENDNINYRALAEADGTIVILMGVKNINKISQRLIAKGKSCDTPTAFIENSGKRVLRTTLENAYKCAKINNIVPPAVIVIGNMAEKSLVCHRPSVAMIGTRDFKHRLGRALYNYDVVDVGTMEIVKQNFEFNLDYDYIVLTSRNGVKIFIDYLKERNIDLRSLSDIKFAVIGSGTYDALKEYGIYADIIPDKYTSLELSKALKECKGKKLILRAAKASEDLYKYIDNYTDIKIYDIKPSNLKLADTDYIVFGSSSAVSYYCNEFKINSKIIAIGEQTAARLKEYGYDPYMADEYSIKGIINKLEVLENDKNEKA